eukprot:TRINITY_DN12859_c0_g1_i1.p1 TRINITY_DN12859_c0_g1~~TRINITY_DN12859_c0_g1_i1.p1  ORF type:complete len:575 (+),score=160.59 TRINITY_DN12859_c0_g1_i1:89-1726(+)
MAVGRGGALVLAVYMMMVGGVPSWAFSAMSGTIKDKFRYTPTQINLIGAFMNAGVWTAVLGGICMDKFGGRVTATAALVMVGGGYTGMWLLTRLDDPRWWAFAVLGYILGQGSYWCYTVALKTCVARFPPAARGRVVGTLVAYVGLAAGIFAQFFTSFFNSVDFFLFLAATQAVPCLLAFVLPSEPVPPEGPPPLAPREEHLLFGINTVTALITVLITVSSILDTTTDLDKVPFGIALAALCLALPVLAEGLARARSRGDPADEDPLLAAPAGSAKKPAPAGNTLGEALRTVDFWLLFAVYFGLAGPGVMMCNSFTQYVISRNRSLDSGRLYLKDDIPHYELIPTLVTLFAVSNTVGRIVAGYATDRGSKAGVHRSLWLVAVAGVMAASQVLFALTNAPYIAVVPLGLCVGGTFAVVPMCVGEFFGMKSFATIWAAETVAPTIGTLAFNGLLGARFEEHYSHDAYVHVKDKAASDPVKYCYGDNCFRDSLLIQGLVCIGAGLAAGAVWWRHRTPAARPPEPPQPSLQRDCAGPGEGAAGEGGDSD